MFLYFPKKKELSVALDKTNRIGDWECWSELSKAECSEVTQNHSELLSTQLTQGFFTQNVLTFYQI